METSGRPEAESRWRRLKDSVVHFYFNPGTIFYKIGLSIGNNPWLWLITSLCLSGVCGSGMSLWREEVDDVELYIPMKAALRSDASWVKEHFKDELTYASILVTASNVLDPEVLRSISEMEDVVKGIVVNGDSWSDVCARYLTWFSNVTSIEELERDYPLLAYGTFRDFLRKDSCIYQSILKLWPEGVSNLTLEEISRDVTEAFHETKNDNGILMDISPLLSTLTYDGSGHVIGAKGTLLNFLLKKSNANSSAWELEFIEKVLYSNRTIPRGMRIYALASRSFHDILDRVLENNLAILFCGPILIMIYVAAMIGRCNKVQQRIYLSLLGVSVTGQAILSAYGVCFYLGFSYGPVHPILPFLLLGIGVDDMFVIIQSLETLTEIEKNSQLPVRIAKALEQSGMSITVTSLTNVIAFGIGMTTVMPFLKSFCMFAAMGIFFLFVYEVMFFVSCLVLDERRVASNKDGCFCTKRSQWRPNECSQRNVQRVIFQEFIGPLLMCRRVKFLVISMAALLLGLNVWGICRLDRNFEPLLYLNQESYPIEFSEKLFELFPNYGRRADIYFDSVDYCEDREALGEMIKALENNSYVNKRTLNSWFTRYGEWLEERYQGVGDCEEYYGKLSEFLFMSKEGQAFVRDMKFDGIPISDYNITITKIGLQHVTIPTAHEREHAMESIREIIQSVNFSKGNEHSAIFAHDYVYWTANQIIGDELIRNLILEILAVSVVSMLLLRDLWVSFWVICCVLFTLIDLLGSMYYVGLTIEISSSIMILLCAGLAVDYAAHVGLEFTRARGTRDERSISTLGLIGPAVFNGGLSTFLAFMLLGASRDYLFSSFFKLFAAVVVFGLFHGLIFLPVILSLLGSEKKKENEKTDNPPWEPNKYCTLPLPHPNNGK
ncbi:patched domain-containing protein 3 isoform X2 [Fopius arisanus]|uniref:Patched domain-containing protein 3 isoform X2 n=2 Tax=Fopius arisanus TaxID=64838 RepID=A0A9R1TFS6_9HYME|nr:PREDICTED: patched domain-containing protein 3-like isoform X2 [Fopius arisanus]